MPEDLFDPGTLLADPGSGQALSLMDSLVRWLTTDGLMIVVILAAAALASLVASWLLRRFFRTMAESGTKLSSVAGAVVKRDARSQKVAQTRREQRAETLSNVARNVAHMLIWAVAAVMILDKIGVNIAPVIASLGVIGLAAGIGAQTIIKDVVAGIVMLFEDIIAVGDYVDVEYAEGTVVGINLRVTQVRGIDGVLWTVRNGEIIRVGNYSRGYSNAVVVLDIDAEADDDVVTTVLRKVTLELAKDTHWSEIIQSPADISGMLDVDANRYQRRVIIQTAPGEQWGLERELRGRVRDAFAETDVSFALPRFADSLQS